MIIFIIFKYKSRILKLSMNLYIYLLIEIIWIFNILEKLRLDHKELQ